MTLISEKRLVFALEDLILFVDVFPFNLEAHTCWVD